MINTTVSIEDIQVRQRLRPLDEGKVKEIMGSIELVGLINPITVDPDYNLIAGFHRLEAMRKLGRPSIPVIIQNISHQQSELIEIDENLIRQELTVLEQAEHIARREQLLEEMGLRAKVGENQHTIIVDVTPLLDGLKCVLDEPECGGVTVTPPKTTKELAQEIGLSENSFQKRKQIANNITPEVKEAIRETSIADSTTQLLELARMQPEEQKEFVEALQTGEVENVKEFKTVKAPIVEVLTDEPKSTGFKPNVEDFTPTKIDGKLTLVPKSCLEETESQSNASMQLPNRFTSMEKSSKTDVHPTPAKITDFLYQFFEIDLDPCSDMGKNIKAKKHYTIEDNGLEQPWQGNVFINPPFSEVAQWSQKAIADYQSGNITELIFLSKFDARVGWFKPLMNTAPLFCVVEGYVSYEGNDGDPATFSTVLWYFGERPEEFTKTFSDLGWICSQVALEF